MANGSYKPIGRVKVGDKVVATDPETGRKTTQTVQKVHVNHDTDLTDLKVSVNGHTAVIHTTEHHPFWDKTRQMWVNAADLSAGDELQSATSARIFAKAVTLVSRLRVMYDLTVSSTHTYYVLASNTPVLVHNCGTARAAANNEAARVADLPNSQRPGVIEALKIGDSDPIVAHSDGGAGNRPVHPIVQEILDSIPAAERGHNHGGCGLVECLTQALSAGQDPTGASAAAVLGRSRTNPNFLKGIGPCPSCQVLTDRFEIEFETGG
jgi:hypothetical protein